ncbi:MAG: acetate--CoA ligase family protein [Candidatus Velthaea sp.]
MIVDTLTVLDLLRERGIRVARSRYVTSAKQAVAFAARGPIALRLVPPAYGADVSLALTDLTSAQMVRRAYERIAAQAQKLAGGQILAQRMVECGTDIGIRCRADAALGRIVEVRSGAHRVVGAAPVDLHQAQAVLANVFDKAQVALEPAALRALALVMVRVCAIFVNTASARLTLDPVRLHRDSYAVIDAKLEMPRAGVTYRRSPRFGFA